MQEKSLLDQVRRLNRLILDSPSGSLSLNATLQNLASVVDGSIFMFSSGGRLLGKNFGSRRVCSGLVEYLAENDTLPSSWDLFPVLAGSEPLVNYTCTANTCALQADVQGSCDHEAMYMTTLPVIASGERLGTLMLTRCGCSFELNDLILAEIGVVLLSLAMRREEQEREEESNRNRILAQAAFDSLSYSEVEAIEEIFRTLEGTDGLIVASKIADHLGITRSVIVNALRKLESAGIIESRSLGMKGTYIHIANPEALREITQRSEKFIRGQELGSGNAR